MSAASERETILLVFDYGEKRIGVALGSSLTRNAWPLTVVQNYNRKYRFQAIGKLIVEWKPDTLVVGLPMHPDGMPHAMTWQAKRFGNQLNGRFNLPIMWVDERFSSVDAAAQIRKKYRYNNNTKQLLDAEAARIILQQYLDENFPTITL